MRAVADAFARSPVGWALVTEGGELADVNPALCRMLGCDRDEVVGRSCWEFAADRDAHREERERESLRTGIPDGFRRDHRFRRRDGRIGTAHVVGSLVSLGSGHAFSCVVDDVTDSRRAGDTRLQAIVDNAPAVIYVKDTALRYVLVNRRWEALYGVTRDDALGRTAQELLDPAEAQRLAALDAEVLRGARAAETLSPVRRSSGGHVEHLTSQFPIFDDAGRVTGVCGIATDVTERRRSAGERAELERRLAQAQRLETVGRLAGGVAHDFNNLLSVILTCAGFALQEAEPQSALHDDLAEIRRAAERGARLVQQLLIFSRREVVQPEVVEPAALVRDIERLLRRSVGERVRLVLDCHDGTPPVLADPSRLEQVLLNLVLNARDALGDDGGTVRVAVCRSPSGGARLAISDDGPGMDAATAERAFEPFFTTKPAGEGTGLGLATVQGIVADSGGTVELDSRPGEGTVVTVDLPPTGAVPPAAAAVPVSAPGRRPGTILLAEDQGPVRRQARRILEAAGYVVVEARDGAEALERLDGSMDLVLTDVVMPGISGQELADRVRTRHPGMAVVVMSGHTEDAVLREGVRDGGLGFVQKPFSESSLLQAVAVALAPEGIA